ncbi:MAG: phospholipase [Alcanivoracaceae bacterium]|jgi:hypothetical protein|nr:phospholipase [Alcanivoracaceae bacterium]
MNFLKIGALCALLLATSHSLAFVGATHRQMVLDAVDYMSRHPGTTNYQRLEAAANAAGYTIDQFATVLADAARDVDNFHDTYLCGAITGDCVRAPAYNLGDEWVNYSSWNHFQNHPGGADAHGNDIGGYNYGKLAYTGTEDELAASWLWNDHMDDGNGGMTGWCSWWSCWEDSEYNSYGITQTRYALGGSMRKSMYEDFQNMAFQPLDNVSQYWYQQFWSSPSAQTLGFVLHATDLLQPHHTWGPIGLGHSDWEGFVEDYYQNYNSDARVTWALGSYTPIPANSTEIRPLLTQGGNLSYSIGGCVIGGDDYACRDAVAQWVVPHGIALVVHVLNHAADRFYVPAGYAAY